MQLKPVITSEEQCGNCAHAFQLSHIVEDCPKCQRPVVACHACMSWEEMQFSDCIECEDGSKHSEIRGY